jgi:hypothetical protein
VNPRQAVCATNRGQTGRDLVPKIEGKKERKKEREKERKKKYTGRNKYIVKVVMVWIELKWLRIGASSFLNTGSG